MIISDADATWAANEFINYFEIKQLHTNKIRAFILRYLEKGNQYIDIDRINSAKVKHWSQRNA